MASRKPILVTGAHRSGTTWVGRMIATSPAVGYIQEPFHPLRRPGICATVFPYTFAYVTEENEAAFYEHLKATLSFQFNVGAALAALKTLRDVAIMLKYASEFFFYHSRQAIPLLKDPLAVFSAEWLAKCFAMNVIVMIRHPAAFASSIRRRNWRHDFSHFLRQPLLMRDHLSAFEAEIAEFAHKEQDIVDQAALLWKLIYSTVLKYKQAHPDWIFLRHEDIAANPLLHFAYLFKRLDLEFSPHIQAVIENYSSPSNPREAQKGPAFGKRNSRATVRSWKTELTEAEIARLRSKVEGIANEFYLDSEW